MKGVSQMGEKHHASKLKEKDVLEIRALIAFGFPATEVGAAYGLHPEYAGLIHRRQRWGHVR
jgi:hypothetical protein